MAGGALPPGLVATSLLVLWTITGSAFLFVGIRVIQACVSFKTVESIEIMNVFTFGGVYAASYPFPIFVTWFRKLLTYGVPLAAVSYYPGLVLMGRIDPIGAPLWTGWVTPAAGIGFCALSLLFWRYALRWYTSTGT
jgi:ABC-2 type transport system permease protein